MDKLSKKALVDSKTIKDQFSSDDIVVKDITIGSNHVCVIYSKGLVDMPVVSDTVVRPLTMLKSYPKKSPIKQIQNAVLFPEIEQVSTITEVVDEIVQGKVIIVADKAEQALSIALAKMKERSIAEPPTSAVLKGPREGFVENIKTNIALIKKIVANPKLNSKSVKLGKYTKTTVQLVYIDGVCDKKVVELVKQQLNKIDIDGVIDSFYVGQFLEQHPHSIFKQVGNTEKPDVVCAKLLEGRVAVLVDGSPIVLTVPYVLLEDLQNSDDYYNKHSRATVLRWLRLFCSLVTMMLPGLYISILLYHYKILPLTFLITIMNSTQNIPFTPFAEILFVLILFEILYEASLRMPQYLGIALSVVGALILGDTAVQAGLISSPAVMIVALSGITLYTMPDQAVQLSLLRFVYTIFGGVLGFYGIIVLSIFLLIYLSALDSYYTPYLAPYAPYIKNDVKDGLFKKDIVDMYTRPRSIPNKNKVRLRHETTNK